MFNGMTTEIPKETPERKPEPVSNEPQPQSKKEPVAKLANELISLTSQAAHLMIQSHLIHLNFEGAQFLPVHAFTKEQYEKHQKELDTIGELVRSLDFLLPMCENGLMKANKKLEHVKAYEGPAMLITYYKNLEAYGMEAKRVGEVAKKIKAPDVEHYCAELVGESFKSAWQIKAMLRGA
jgi:DNA-binding ferritin-like protein